MLPELYTPRDLSKAIGKSERWWRDRCANKEIDVIKLGTSYYVRYESALKFLEQNTCHAKTQGQSSNGDRTTGSTKSSGSKTENVSGSQLALTASRMLKKNSQNTSRSCPNVVGFPQSKGI